MASKTSNPAAPVKADQATEARLVESYGKLPLSFEANQGQTDPQVRFLTCGLGYSLFLTPTEAVLALRKSSSADLPSRSAALKQSAKGKAAESKSASAIQGQSRTAAVLRMKLVGADSAAQVTGLEELPGKSNYFLGNDPKKWRTNVPNYAKVQYNDIYSGVDLVYYGNQQQLEYDFVVAPGANPSAISVTIEGADDVDVNDLGDLVVDVGKGSEVTFQKPHVYQEASGARQEIDGRYVLKTRAGKHGSPRHPPVVEVGFEVPSYDPTKTLIIDPTLSYSTYLGGSGSDNADTIAVDASGNAYLTGYTTSTDYPTGNNPVQATSGGNQDAFVTKLNAAGNALLYSTYLGAAPITTTPKASPWTRSATRTWRKAPIRSTSPPATRPSPVSGAAYAGEVIRQPTLVTMPF